MGRDATTRLEQLHARLEPSGAGFEVAETHAATANERIALAKRAADLDHGAVPAAIAEIDTAIAALLASYPAGRGHKDDPKTVLAMFRRALGDVPRWALMEACGNWNRAGKFAPTPAELRAAALDLAAPFARERAMIRAVLDANVYRAVPDAERERVTAGFKRLLADIEGRTRMQDAATPEPWRAEFEALIRDGRDDEAAALMARHKPLPELSPALAADAMKREAMLEQAARRREERNRA